VTSVRGAAKQLKLRLYQFEGEHQLQQQLQEFNITFISSFHVLWSSYVVVRNAFHVGKLHISQNK
jgi:hypothetical protein